jgi:hypothetical protein
MRAAISSDFTALVNGDPLGICGHSGQSMIGIGAEVAVAAGVNSIPDTAIITVRIANVNFGIIEFRFGRLNFLNNMLS